MVNVSPRNIQIEPQLWRSGNGSRYAGVCEVQIYMKEETKKGLYLKFQRDRSMRSPPTMRVFVKFASVKMAALRWLIFLCAKRFTSCSC